MDNRLVSVPTNFVSFSFMSNNAPFNSNFGLLLSMADEIFFNPLIRLIESKVI